MPPLIYVRLFCNNRVFIQENKLKRQRLKISYREKLSKITKDLIVQSLFRAVSAKRPEPGLIHYSSDRGGQYCSREYGKILNQFGTKTSMSRKGD